MRSRSTVLVALLAGVAAVAAAQTPSADKPGSSPAAPTAGTTASDDEKAIYAVGLSLWRTLAPLDLSPGEIEVLKRGLSDAASGQAGIAIPDAGSRIEAFRKARAQRATEREKARSAAYLEKVEKEPGAAKFSSGLVLFELQAGTGDTPQAGDTVKVHYRGTLVDGTEFDSSYKRDQPAQFSLNRVIRCWTEGVQSMKVGGKARLICPPSIAYGNRGFQAKAPGQQSIPGGAALTFEVELIGIVRAPASPPAAQRSPSPAAKKPSPTPSPGPRSRR